MHQEITTVPDEKKPQGGKRNGAGRPREEETAFAVWARERNLSTKELADKLGVQPRMVNLLLSGKARPGLEALAKLDHLAQDEKGYALFPAEYWVNLLKSKGNQE